MNGMKGAKAVNMISRVLKIIGTTLVIIALVLVLYAAINTGGRWGELKTDMEAYHVDTGFADRVRFDNRFFSALSAGSRVIAKNGISSTGTLTDAESAIISDAISPYFKPYYDRARANASTAFAEEDQEVYRWFEEELDPAAIIEAADDIEMILQSHEIEEIFEALDDLYTPPPKLKNVSKPSQRPYFESFYLAYREAHPEDDSTWFEFLASVRLMVQWEQESGNKITSEARQWYTQSFDDETYQRALEQVRLEERTEKPDNYVVSLIDLCERKVAGESVSFRALLDDTCQALRTRYSDDVMADQHVFLLTIRDLTASLLPEMEKTEEDTQAVENGAQEETAQQAEETSEEETEEADTLIPAAISSLNRFDGSYAKIRDAMLRKSAALAEGSPDKLEAAYMEKLFKDTRDRSSIGTVVAVFWSLVSRYMLILCVGVGLLLLAFAMKKILHGVLLNKKEIVEEAAKAAAMAKDQAAPEQPEAFGDDVLLRVSHLKQYFRSGSYVNKAVDDISFYVKKGEVFGLVGESGCGKTTTGRTIINLYDPTEGDVYFEGLRISSNLNGLPVLRRSLRNECDQAIAAEKENLKEAVRKDSGSEASLTSACKTRIAELKQELKQKLSNAETNALISQVEKNRATSMYREHCCKELNEAFERNSSGLSGEALDQAKKKLQEDIRLAQKSNIMSKMQMIFQDPISSINPRMTVREIIAEGLIIQGVKDKEYINEKVYEMLELVGLVREHADRYPHEFSGGQRQRIGIARAIIMNPELIIADEPISALDVSIQAQVINLLNDLRNRMGLTIMFIAHNLSVVKYFSDRIAVMYYGHIVEMTTSDELFAHPLHPYTKSLLSAIPYPDPRYEKTRQRIEYNPARAHDYSVDKPSLRQITPGHYIHCNDAEFEQYRKELGL